MSKNTLRMTVRDDSTDPVGVTLPLAAAVNSQRYERPSQLAFVEDGVRVAAGLGIDEVDVEGWPSLAELVGDANALGIGAFACADCAAQRDVGTADSAIERLRWVASQDIHLPLHECREESETLTLITIGAQRQEQVEFDEQVGHVTIGARPGEA